MDLPWEMREADEMRGIHEMEPRELTEADAKRMAGYLNERPEMDEIQEDTTSMEEKTVALGVPCTADWGFDFFDLTINRDVCSTCHKVWEAHPCPVCKTNLRQRFYATCALCQKSQTA